MSDSNLSSHTSIFIDLRNILCGQLGWSSPEGDEIILRPGSDVPEVEAISSKRFLPYGIRLAAQPATKEEPFPSGQEIPGQVIHDSGRYRSWSLNASEGNILYRESDDAYEWSAPVECPFETHGETPIGEGGFFIDPAAAPGEGYKLIYNARVPDNDYDRFHQRVVESPRPYRDQRMVMRTKARGLGSIYGAVSADGLHWKGLAEPLLMHLGDTDISLYYDGELNKYVAYSRIFRQDRRWIGRAESDDFRNWGPLVPMIRPELDDSPFVDVYLNSRSEYPGLPDHHLMFPMFYNRNDESSVVHFYSSEDGFSWGRVPGGPILSPGAPGDWDGSFIYAGRHLVPLGSDRIAVPYSGTSYPHKYPRWQTVSDAWRSAWAWWPKDRLCAVVADQQGEFYTPSRVPAGRQLRINARVERGGEIRVGIDTTSDGSSPDEQQRRICHCDPIFGDHMAKTVTWNGESDTGLKEEEPASLHFSLRAAEIFGFQWC